MVQLRIDDHRLDVDLIIFDKDGTLLDFHQAWVPRTRHAVAALVRHSNGDATLARALFTALGLDPQRDRVVPDSPLSSAAMSTLYTIAAAVLYQHGTPWHRAETAVREAFIPVMSALPTRTELHPLADLKALFTRLHDAGLALAIVTSDNRTPTAASLTLLGLTPYLSHLVCADDDLPTKPSPAIVRHVAAACNVPLARVLVVGDTVGDMLMGADAGFRLGISGGAGDPQALAAHADLVVPSVSAIAPA